MRRVWIIKITYRPENIKKIKKVFGNILLVLGFFLSFVMASSFDYYDEYYTFETAREEIIAYLKIMSLGIIGFLFIILGSKISSPR